MLPTSIVQASSFTCAEKCLKSKVTPFVHCGQVSLATFGSSCSPLPSAALDLVRNFTAAQRMQEASPSDGHLILAVHAAHVSEHFDRARRVHKKVGCPPIRFHGDPCSITLFKS